MLTPNFCAWLIVRGASLDFSMSRYLVDRIGLRSQTLRF